LKKEPQIKSNVSYIYSEEDLEGDELKYENVERISFGNENVERIVI